MRIDIDETTVDDGSHYFCNGGLFTGELEETDPAGNVIALTPVTNGRPHGVDREWYPDGTLRSETTVVDGVATGTSREWHRNGRLAEERDFDERGRLIATRKWTEDGTPVQREPRNKAR